MAKAKAPPPPHVMAAILRGDTEAVRAFGQRGGRRAAQEQKLKAVRAKAQAAANDAAINALMDNLARQQIVRDAELHALRNKPGWADD